MKLKVKSQKFKYSLQPSMIFLVLAVFLGGIIRIYPVINSSFPLNDGGLFFTMTNELIAEGFTIPDFTSYNHLKIPFAYPPLGFYLAGGISEITGWNLLGIFQFLPAIFSILAIPAFYLFAKVFLNNQFSLGISVLIFSLLPTTIDSLIMGGG